MNDRAQGLVDLLVIGGGINGVGVARDAAGRGLSVILCEKDDLAQGTSGRSGKYIHGGLRYLEHYEFRLVQRALREREVILENAPHLAWPLQLILVHSPEQRPRWLIRLGLHLYDNLGGRKRVPRTTALDLATVPEGVPVRPGFSKGFAYWDVWVDDCRLVVLNAVDAARRGARVLVYTECVSARREGKLWHAILRDHKSGQERRVAARVLFNAAGPWVESVLADVAGLNASRRIRLVKGSHIIMKRWWKGAHGYALQSSDRRLVFVNPYMEDLALVGTTDVPYEGRPEDVEVSNDEIDYLVGVLNRYFCKELSPHDVLWHYSGVRPLFDDDERKNASRVTRDYVFEVSGDPPGGEDPPLISAFGGKLTTYRKLAEHGLERLQPYFPEMGGPWTASAALPGGDIPGADFDSWYAEFRHDYPWLERKLALHLARCYGTEAEAVLDGTRSPEDLGKHFGGLFYEREASYLVENEWARNAEDILERRTKHGLFLSGQARTALEDWLAARGRGA